MKNSDLKFENVNPSNELEKSSFSVKADPTEIEDDNAIKIAIKTTCLIFLFRIDKINLFFCFFVIFF